MSDHKKQAIQYLASAISDYANTLPPSVRGPFVRECQSVFQVLEAEAVATSTPPGAKEAQDAHANPSAPSPNA